MDGLGNSKEELTKRESFLRKVRPILSEEIHAFMQKYLQKEKDSPDDRISYKEIKFINKTEALLNDNNILFFGDNEEDLYKSHFEVKKNVINSITGVVENTIKKSYNDRGMTPSYVPLHDLLFKIVPCVKENGALLQFKSNSSDSDVISLCLVFQTQYAVEQSNVFFNYRLYSGSISNNISPVQEMGSVLTYLKRYLLLGFFCIATADGVDPDSYTIENKNKNNHGKSGFKKLYK